MEEPAQPGGSARAQGCESTHQTIFETDLE